MDSRNMKHLLGVAVEKGKPKGVARRHQACLPLGGEGNAVKVAFPC
jgi:hypothetical protein